MAVAQEVLAAGMDLGIGGGQDPDAVQAAVRRWRKRLRECADNTGLEEMRAAISEVWADTLSDKVRFADATKQDELLFFLQDTSVPMAVWSAKIENASWTDDDLRAAVFPEKKVTGDAGVAVVWEFVYADPSRMQLHGLPVPEKDVTESVGQGWYNQAAKVLMVPDPAVVGVRIQARVKSDMQAADVRQFGFVGGIGPVAAPAAQLGSAPRGFLPTLQKAAGIAGAPQGIGGGMPVPGFASGLFGGAPPAPAGSNPYVQQQQQQQQYPQFMPGMESGMYSPGFGTPPSAGGVYGYPQAYGMPNAGGMAGMQWHPGAGVPGPMPGALGLAAYGLRTGSHIRPGHKRVAREVLELVGHTAESVSSYVRVVHKSVQEEAPGRWAEMTTLAAALDSEIAYGLSAGLSLEQLLAVDSLEILCSRLAALVYFERTGDVHGMSEAAAINADGHLFSSETRARISKNTREYYKHADAVEAGRGKSKGRGKGRDYDSGRQCPACGGRHQVRDCPDVKAVQQSRGGRGGDGKGAGTPEDGAPGAKR